MSYLTGPKKISMRVHTSEADHAPSIARILKAINAPGNAYIHRTDPPAVSLRKGGWHPIPPEMMQAAAESGLDIWCRPGAGRRPRRVFIRRPGWKGMLDEQFVEAMCFCIRFWPVQAEQGLLAAEPSMLAELVASTAIHNLDISAFAPLLQSEVPQVRLAAIRLLGARRHAAVETAR